MRAIICVCALACGPLGAATPEIVVYFGVPCGVAASIAAAREGARVVLVEPTQHVGGLSTSDRSLISSPVGRKSANA